MFEIQVGKYKSVVCLGGYGQHKEFRRTECMPFGIAFSCVDVGSASHKQTSSDYPYYEHDSWLVLVDIDNFLDSDSLEIKMVREPSKTQESGA